MDDTRGRLSRRDLLRYGAYAGAGLYLVGRVPGARGARVVAVAGAGPSLDAAAIDRFVTPLTIPPGDAEDGKIALKGGKSIDYYEIAVRQFQQQVLPAEWTRRRSGATARQRRPARSTTRRSRSRRSGRRPCG